MLRIEVASGRTVAVLSNRSGSEEANASDLPKALLAATGAGACAP